MADLDYILNNIDLEEELIETEEKAKDWYCGSCEHGPMMDNDTNCSRCGEKHIASRHQEEMTGWEDEDIEAEVEEIF
jgi:uncharacterized paraquat-inducible protein A